MKRLLMAISVLFVAETASAQCLATLVTEEGDNRPNGQVVVKLEYVTPNGLTCGIPSEGGTSWTAYYCKGPNCRPHPIRTSTDSRNRAWIQTRIHGYYTVFAANRRDFTTAFIRIKRVGR